MKHTIDTIKPLGFDFSLQGARYFRSKNVAADVNRLAADVQMITTPNTSIPIEYLAFIDPTVVDILTAPRNAREILSEAKKGDWFTPYTKWRVNEIVGGTQPYSDFANGTTSDSNYEYLSRKQYVFQTTIKYGDLEVDASAAAKINLAGDKQTAAATILDIDSNKFALLGVEGREIYGLLNDPNLPAAITAAAVGTGSSSKWEDKDTKQIYNDIRALYNELVTNSSGLINQNSPLKLIISPASSTYLGVATDFNVSVLDMLMKFFKNLTIITLPELSSLTAGETLMMMADNIYGKPVAEIGFSIKVKAFPLVRMHSSSEQKWASSTYGTVVYYPFAIASMTGI